MEIQGLSSQEARRLLERYGPNVLARRKKISVFSVLFRQFFSPLIIVLVCAGLISGFFLREWVDASIIGATVLLNTFLGFFQEYHAERSFEALQQFVVPRARVIRDGKRMDIDASLLVPGDIVILEIGRTIPADGGLLEATDMSVNEAMLTGESVPVRKDVSSSLVFMGTTVVTGIGVMNVLATGADTKMGKIAGSLESINRQLTPLQRQIHALATTLSVVIGVVSLFIFSMGSLLGRPPLDMFKLSVAVAVSAVPEGLAVSLTAILAVGMRRIFKRHALVRKLVSAETLGSVTVICSDKTGTLTEGNMRVTGMEFTDEEMGKTAMTVCNDLRDPLETAMFDSVSDAQERVRQFPRFAEIPFSPTYKYIATLHQYKEEGKMKKEKGLAKLNSSLFVSGAPEVLLEKSILSQEEKQRWHRKFKGHAKEGLRLVGMAWKEIERRDGRLNGDQVSLSHSDVSSLTFLGVVLFQDPIREGVAKSLAEAQQLGLKINIVTGDYLETTEAVLRKLKVESGKLKVEEIKIYARVTPEQKLKIVEDLKKQGEIVAMMGDGVNDVLALKTADISIVVFGASDVAKQLADVILIDNNFGTIVSTILEGRGIFVTIKKVLSYLLSDSFAEVVLIAGAFILPIPLPITAVMILWVNLVADGFPSLALTVEPTTSTVRARGSLFDWNMKAFIIVISLWKGAVTLGYFWWMWTMTGNVLLSRSAAFAMMVTISLFSVFSLRSRERSIVQVKFFSNIWLLVAVGTSFSLLLLLLWNTFFQELFGTTMLRFSQWIVILGAGGLTIAVIEAMKWWSRMFDRPIDQ